MSSPGSMHYSLRRPNREPLRAAREMRDAALVEGVLLQSQQGVAAPMPLACGWL